MMLTASDNLTVANFPIPWSIFSCTELVPASLQAASRAQTKTRKVYINCIYTWAGTWVRLAHGPELLLLDEAEAPAQAPEALHHEAEVAGHHRAREGDVLGDPGTLDITGSPRYML